MKRKIKLIGIPAIIAASILTATMPAWAGQTDLAHQYKCSQHVPAKHVRGYLVEITTRGHTTTVHLIKGAVLESAPRPGVTMTIVAECRR